MAADIALIGARLLDKASHISVATMTKKTPIIRDMLFRSSGASLVLLLALAYLTGEEFQHTHMIIGYAIASVLLTGLSWELLRSRLESRGPATPRGPLGSASVVSLAIFFVLAIIALFALLLIGATHTLWGVSADEMHEVITYFALGLTMFYVAAVLVVSIELIENRPRKLQK